MYYRSEHWFALRRLGSFWFDLNSMQPIPKLLSDTYLSLFLEQNRAQGYSIFVVRGNFPPVDIETRPRDLQAAVDACRAHYSVRYYGCISTLLSLLCCTLLLYVTTVTILYVIIVRPLRMFTYLLLTVLCTFTVVLFCTFHSIRECNIHTINNKRSVMSYVSASATRKTGS